MRTWGRIKQKDGTNKWTEFRSDKNDDFSLGWVVTLIQTLKLRMGEAPFFADWGLPAEEAIQNQMYPDYYVRLIQQRFAIYFASLSIVREPSINDLEVDPVYTVNVVLKNGQNLKYQVNNA